MQKLIRQLPFFESKSYKIITVDGELNIINYTEIVHFTDTNIIIKAENKYITVKGDNLTISKLLLDEVLINGVIKSIEIR